MELIDSHVSAKQCKRAVEALHTYATKQENERAENELLPGNEQHIWLQIAVKMMQPEQKLKPIRVPLKYPVIDPRTSSVCLITKDPQREYKDLLEQHKIKFISRVVGVEKLKGKFKAYEARRLLLKENAMFLADERVIPLLPRLLGSKWFEAKKQPIPVNLTRKDLKGELERAIESSYMHQNKGTCTSVKVGILSHTPKQIQTNLETALPAIVGHIKGGWDNIQSLHIKTSTSISLPIWTCDLGDEEGGRWNGLIAGEEAEGEASSQGDDADSEDEALEDAVKTSKPPAQETRTKGTKRQLEDGAEKPNKKKKASLDAVPSPPEKPSSSSKSKSKKSDATPFAASTSVLPPSSPASKVAKEAPIKKGTKAKEKSEDSLAPDPEVHSTNDPLLAQPDKREKSKSSKKSKTSTAESPDQSTDLMPASSDGQGKRKAAKTAVASAPTPRTPVSPREKHSSKSSPSVTVTTAATTAVEPPPKKKGKHAKVAEEFAGTATGSSNLDDLPKPSEGTISQKDVKSKRSNETGEKKKAKVVKGQKGRSAKDALLGKKAGQS
ncbi:hypothetical protein HYDPIDRAFT_182713 [Hydnomerulius pinastri MD-312]|uniref:Ribosomal protein L1 n=1 Tax=Hydnomerulius pinastri MD-312 TaxID=994086 RepID=A0A0C9VWX9_9AGAM|nr:hypothetical protein HYDPIDRAFT_182713 [Hydnomerulius pinastri MD-312]